MTVIVHDYSFTSDRFNVSLLQELSPAVVNLQDNEGRTGETRGYLIVVVDSKVKSFL